MELTKIRQESLDLASQLRGLSEQEDDGVSEFASASWRANLIRSLRTLSRRFASASWAASARGRRG